MPSKQTHFDRFIRILRITGILVGLVNIALGIYELATFSLDPRSAINAIYSILFGSFMIICEARWVKVLHHFYFLQHFLGLGAFYLFVGGLALGGTWYQYAVAGCCIGVGIVYFTLGLGCRRMGHENFRSLGFRTGNKAADAGIGGAAAIPSTAATDNHHHQPQPSPSASTNEGQPATYSSSAYAPSPSAYQQNGDEPANYEEPAAIRDARRSAYE